MADLVSFLSALGRMDAMSLLAVLPSANQSTILNLQSDKGEVIYQHDDETALALVEAMRFLAGEDALRKLLIACGDYLTRLMPQSIKFWNFWPPAGWHLPHDLRIPRWAGTGDDCRVEEDDTSC